jgi:16S rRNA (cytidine1402-2'-O)-methyltransferase
MASTILGKLYYNNGRLWSHGCIAANYKRSIDLIDSYIVENDKTARKSIKIVNPEKQADLKLFILNKHTETKEHLDFIKPCWLEKTWG